MTKIAIATTDDRGLDAPISAHFGRCSHYVTVDLDGDAFGDPTVHPTSTLGSHAPGVMPAFVQHLGADIVLAGGMGPKAVQMFEMMGIQVATGAAGSARSALDAWIAGRLRGTVPCAHDHPDSCSDSDAGRCGHDR